MDPFADRFRAQNQALSPAAHRVARFIDKNRATVLASSAADLAASVGTSDATVVRAVQALGFDGLPELKQVLAATIEQRSSPADDMRETLAEVGENADRAIDLVLDTHQQTFNALQTAKVRAKITDAVSCLHRAQRIVVFGIGPTAAIAHYMAALLARSGRQTRTLDATGIELADQLLELRERDALLILAYGRSYREVVATFAEARRLHLPTVLVTDTLERKLARSADVVIPAERGRAHRVALHGTTLVVLEAIVLGLAASNRKRAMDTLARLNDLREMVNGARYNLG
jgi:DNA-binding MurR/RpiR family transcriptional regulator